MSENNKRNGNIVVGIGAAGILTIAGWGYNGIRDDIRELRKDISEVRLIQSERGERIGKVENELKALREERARGVTLRDKESAEFRAELERLRGERRK